MLSQNLVGEASPERPNLEAIRLVVACLTLKTKVLISKKKGRKNWLWAMVSRGAQGFQKLFVVSWVHFSIARNPSPLVFANLKLPCITNFFQPRWSTLVGVAHLPNPTKKKTSPPLRSLFTYLSKKLRDFRKHSLKTYSWEHLGANSCRSTFLASFPCRSWPLGARCLTASRPLHVPPMRPPGMRRVDDCGSMEGGERRS